MCVCSWNEWVLNHQVWWFFPTFSNTPICVAWLRHRNCALWISIFLNEACMVPKSSR